jgi:general stress protein YciG
MDPNKQRAVASKGGKAAHAKGTAHEWSREQAREAGRKGGLAHARRKKPAIQPAAAPKAENPAQPTTTNSRAATSHRNAGAHSR